MAAPRLALATLLSALVAGCSSGASINPVDWWHSLQGGPLAETRPPPPNADAPYPNLGAVPTKPAAPDSKVRGTLSTGLVADRTNAQYAASLVPIQPLPSAGTPPPQLPHPAGGDDQAMGATMAAASAPPSTGPASTGPASTGPASTGPIGPLGAPPPPLPNTPVTPPRKAPVAPVQAAPLAPLAAPAAAAVVPNPQQAAALPGMPDQPPGQPSIPGVSLPKVVPTPPPEAPKPVAAPPVPVKPGDPVNVAFVPGSATLPPAALVQLKALAQTRGTLPISVIGYGEAVSSQATAQSDALPLALARARAIAANLQADGVAPGDLRIGAEAQGQGGAAHIIAP